MMPYNDDIKLFHAKKKFVQNNISIEWSQELKIERKMKYIKETEKKIILKFQYL